MLVAFLLLLGCTALVLNTMKPVPAAFNNLKISTGKITFIDTGKGHWSKLNDQHITKTAGAFGASDPFGSVDGLQNFQVVTASLIQVHTFLGSVDVVLQISRDGNVVFSQTPAEILAKWQTQSLADLLQLVAAGLVITYLIFDKLKSGDFRGQVLPSNFD